MTSIDSLRILNPRVSVTARSFLSSPNGSAIRSWTISGPSGGRRAASTIPDPTIRTSPSSTRSSSPACGRRNWGSAHRQPQHRCENLEVERSRHLGAEAAPKTQRARRTVRLTPGNVEVLRPLIELKGRLHDYLFKNVRGEPIEASNFYDLFRDAQRALSISPLRDLYSTKDTSSHSR
jgi:hypothetical protein